MKYITTIDDKQFVVEIIDEKHVSVDGKVYEIDFESVSGQPVYSLIVDGRSHESYIYQGDDNWQVLMRGRLYPVLDLRRYLGMRGRLYPVQVEDEREKRLRAAAGGGIAETGEYHLRAPMPGLVVAIPVSEGQPVKRGEVILILESMKMQNELKAPRDGTIGRLRVRPGETVEQKQTLLSLM